MLVLNWALQQVQAAIQAALPWGPAVQWIVLEEVVKTGCCLEPLAESIMNHMAGP